MVIATLLTAILVAAPSYTVVLADGHAVRAQAVPSIRDGLAVVTLVDGSLASFAADRIDWAATEAANRQRPALIAASTSSPTEERASIVISNQTIAATAPAAGVPAATGDSGVVVLTSVAPPASIASALARVAADSVGRAPEYWRERARYSRDRLRQAESEHRALAGALAKENDAALRGRKLVSADGVLVIREFADTAEQRAAQRYRISELEERVRLAWSRIAQLVAEDADLRDEARLAGADPGWLRVNTPIDR